MAKTHANRGRALEETIIYINDRYLARRVAVINKIPTPWIPKRGKSGNIEDAFVKEKSTVDFTGNYQGIPVAFDTKETKNKSISVNALQNHQAEFLSNWSLTGGISFILVGFGDMKNTFIVPWSFWEKWKDDYFNGGPASMKISDLPSEWNIPLGGYYGLDYLKTVATIYGISSSCTNHKI